MLCVVFNFGVFLSTISWIFLLFLLCLRKFVMCLNLENLEEY